MTTPALPNITVEVNEGVNASAALARLEPGASYTSQGDAVPGQRAVVKQIADVSAVDLQQGIESICAVITAAMTKVAPDSCSAEFSLGFKAGLKVPVLMSGEANAALKVTLSWKRTAG
jgi:hypothetical protein